MTDAFLSVPDWDKLQHYADRSPPWIKLHNELLENYEFECLPDASKAHLLCIFLLASRTGNKISADPRWIARKIGANSKVDVDLLVDVGFLQLNQPLRNEEQSASTVLASRLPREEGEESREEGEESRKQGPDKSDLPAKRTNKFIPPTLAEVTGYCKERKNRVNPQAFIDHYETNGWMRGKNKIKNWKACVHTWENNDRPNGKDPESLDQFVDRATAAGERLKENMERREYEQQ